MPPQPVPQQRSQSEPRFQPVPVNVDTFAGADVPALSSNGAPSPADLRNPQAQNTPVRSCTAHFGETTDDLLKRVDKALEEEDERASETTVVESGTALAQFGQPVPGPIPTLFHTGQNTYPTPGQPYFAPGIPPFAQNVPEVSQDVEMLSPSPNEAYSFAGSTAKSSPDLQAELEPHREKPLRIDEEQLLLAEGQIEKPIKEAKGNPPRSPKSSRSLASPRLPPGTGSPKKVSKGAKSPRRTNSKVKTIGSEEDLSTLPGREWFRARPVTEPSVQASEDVPTMTHMADTQRDTVLAVTALAKSISASSNALSKRIEELELDFKENFKNASARDVACKMHNEKPRAMSPEYEHRPDVSPAGKTLMDKEPDPDGFSFARYRAVTDLSLPVSDLSSFFRLIIMRKVHLQVKISQDSNVIFHSHTKIGQVASLPLQRSATRRYWLAALLLLPADRTHAEVGTLRSSWGRNPTSGPVG